MTKEELAKEAEEKLSQAELDYCHELSNPCEPSELPYSELLRFETGYKRGYLAGAKSREKRIAKLEVQIEKMKFCEICKHSYRIENELHCTYHPICKETCLSNKRKYWELKED